MVFLGLAGSLLVLVDVANNVVVGEIKVGDEINYLHRKPIVISGGLEYNFGYSGAFMG